jgi:ribonuclease E
MTKRMLIDATHAEETRVVVLDGNRLEDYDTETSTKKQLKGNIYLAKVVRVEPSLQAAFVEYGGNRHGFLAFSEIHPDYYQIPVADRQRLLELQEQEARDEEEAEDRAAARSSSHGSSHGSHGHHRAARDDSAEVEEVPAEPDHGGEADAGDAVETQALTIPTEVRAGSDDDDLAIPPVPDDAVTLHADVADVMPIPEAEDVGADLAPEAAEPVVMEHTAETVTADDDTPAIVDAAATDAGEVEPDHDDDSSEPAADAPPPETLGGENDTEESRERRPSRFMRNYKIQEVIRRRQILLIQVVKEERGTKGAALTTYISLAGRFSVLMPNSPRGGGISRKITSIADRKRLKEATAELELPRGMGLIVRTAGANRPKPEIKRDGEYLLRLWDDIRERTMQSVAPALIYEEASLIKRAIRDVYSRDVDDILVDGQEGWHAAHEFMRMLMPAHARKVQLWQQPQPLFAAHQVEAQLDAMLSPTVQLKSGGYLVINQTEALVAIDVNSGRSTRERGIEETALRTNLEAADEAARQLRLRDLAGLIVIDFIDMEAKKHNAMVERRMKEALKNDRARIQIGHISHFGLMELSRQRLRPSLAETTFVPCVHCGGTGHMRSTEGAAMHVLRAIEEEGARRRAAELLVHVGSGIALYILNHKRAWLAEIEARHAMQVTFAADDKLIPPELRLERLRAQDAPPPVVSAAGVSSPVAIPIAQHPAPAAIAPPPMMAPITSDFDDEDVPDEIDDDVAPVSVEARPRPAAAPAPVMAAADAVAGETAEEGERKRRRRRRRRRGGRREDGTMAGPEQNGAAGEADGAGESDDEDEAETPIAAEAPEPAAEPMFGGEPVVSGERFDEPRRRNRRGRRRRPDDAPMMPAQDFVPAYVGPTPADPFGGHAYDIFDVIEQQLALAEQAANNPPPVDAVEPEPAAAPAIQPVLIGSAEIIGEKKRGWWRR